MPSASAVPIPDRPFDPYELRPPASLNRRRLLPLPGLDSAWAGKTGWELCSTPALVQLIQSRSAELGLEEESLALTSRDSPGGSGQGYNPGGLGQGDSGAARLPPRLNALLDSPDPAAQLAARAIAATYGQRLGGLVASILHTPDAGQAPALDAWEAAYLRHWRQEVRQVFLGGGLSNGLLGEIAAGEAEATLKKCGIQRLIVRPARNPSYLPLIGAARRLPPGEGRVSAVADFGSTWAKRGLAYYGASGALERVVVLPPAKAAPWLAPGDAARLAAEMVAFLADTLRQAGPDARLAPDVVCSLAAYVVDGQPAPQTGTSPGGYYGLHAISEDLCGWFSEQVSQAAIESTISGASGRSFRVHFAHDGGTAAAALAGEEKAAVIMLGSALGVGFVPPVEGIRAVLPNFNINFKESSPRPQRGAARRTQRAQRLY